MSHPFFPFSRYKVKIGCKCLSAPGTNVIVQAPVARSTFLSLGRETCSTGKARNTAVKARSSEKENVSRVNQ